MRIMLPWVALCFVALTGCHDFTQALEACRDAGRCVSATEPIDAGRIDAGGAGRDGGLIDAGRTDSGTAAGDSGTVVDGGMPVVDAGQPDSGEGPVDAGPTTTTLSVSPAAGLSFGNVALGDFSAGQLVTVTNIGAVTATNVRFTLPSGFAKTNFISCPSSLSPGEDCKIQVVFNPVFAQVYSVMAAALADNALQVSFLLTGTGVTSSLLFDPPSFDFGVVPMGSSAVTKPFVVSNNGTVPVNGLQVSLESDAGVFSFTNTNCGTTLGMNEVCEVKVVMNPSMSGAAQGALVATGSSGAVRRAALSMRAGSVITLSVDGGVVSERVITDDVTDGGFRCAGQCSVLVPHGEVRTFRLEATRTRTQLLSWRGACSGREACSVTSTGATMQLGADVVSNNYVFITSGTYPGNLGGRSGSDAKCDAAAVSAGLPADHYKAFLARNNAMPVVDVVLPPNSRGWVRTDGRPFADERSMVHSEKSHFPPLLDEAGMAVAADATAWTGARSGSGGILSTPRTCGSSGAEWTNTSEQGHLGDPFATKWFTSDQAQGCAQSNHLYCFGTDRQDVLVPPAAPPTARRLFLSTNLADSVATHAQLDALCTAEALDGGLTSDAGFGVLRAELGQAAAAAFDLTKGPWYRADRIPVFAPATRLSSPNGALVPPGMYLSGDAPGAPRIFMGASSAGAAGTADTACTGWVPTTDGGTFVQMNAARAGWSPETFVCATDIVGTPYFTPGLVLCLER